MTNRIQEHTHICSARQFFPSASLFLYSLSLAPTVTHLCPEYSVVLYLRSDWCYHDPTQSVQSSLVHSVNWAIVCLVCVFHPLAHNSTACVECIPKIYSFRCPLSLSLSSTTNCLPTRKFTTLSREIYQRNCLHYSCHSIAPLTVWLWWQSLCIISILEIDVTIDNKNRWHWEHRHLWYFNIMHNRNEEWHLRKWSENMCKE